MGKRGTKPMPKIFHDLNGNPSKREHAEDAKAEGKMYAPDWVDNLALEKWNDLHPELEKMFGAGFVDSDALAIYCYAYADFVSLIDSEPTIQTVQGCKANPDVAQRNRCIEQMRKYGAVLGLSPSDRVGMPSKDATANDPASEFIA